MAANELSQFKLDLSAFKGIGAGVEEHHETRYITPPYAPEIKEHLLKPQNAQKLADELYDREGLRAFAVVNGSFCFGDFIEYWIVKHNWHIKQMTISTLSLNENNVDSLANLLRGDYVDSLSLIISAYQYAHDRFTLVPYILQELDQENRFQFAAASTHCKLCIFETHCGRKMVIHGSANLRSSGNIEQFMVEENPALYDFNHFYQAAIIDEFKIINHDAPNPQKLKALRHQKLWQVVVQDSPSSTAIAGKPSTPARPRRGSAPRAAPSAEA